MAKPTDTKARILAVALELFTERGVQSTSLREISERLGITKPALYYHFASRDDLVKSIIRPLTDDMDKLMATMEPGEPRELLGDYFDVIWRHRAVAVMMVRDLSAFSYFDLPERMFAFRRRLAELLLGPGPSAARHIHATVAIGGMADCVVEYAQSPYDEVKAAAVDAAVAALGGSGVA